MLPLITRRGRKLLGDAAKAELLTTDLGIYEAGNGLRKMSALLKTISAQGAVSIVETLKQATARHIIPTVTFESLDLAETLRIAQNERLTFYDASYIAVSRNRNAILVTDDKKLQLAAKNHIESITYLTLESALAKR